MKGWNMVNITRHQRTITASQTQISSWKTIFIYFQVKVFPVSALFSLGEVRLCPSNQPIQLISFLLSLHFKKFAQNTQDNWREMATNSLIPSHSIIFSALCDIPKANYWILWLYDMPQRKSILWYLRYLKQISQNLCLLIMLLLTVKQT